MTNEEMAQAIEQVLRDYSIYSNDAAKLAKIAAALRAADRNADSRAAELKRWNAED